MAWWYRHYAPNIVRLAGLESEAKGASRGVWSQPNPAPPREWRHAKQAVPAGLEGKVLANGRSHVYHTPGCPNAARISASNRVTFDTAEAAERAGYRSGKDCHCL